MMLRSSAFAAALALTASVAFGQGCVIETDSPPDLRGAAINIGKIADDGQSARMSEKPTHFRRTLTLLYENTANIKNQIGRQYLLGRLYAVWLYSNLPGMKTITTRADLKLFGGDSKRKHDLYMAMDSAFAKVEAENPACVDSTAKYRGAVSQMAYNEARTMLDAQNYDSAVVLAKRALVADPKGAAPWNILAEANKQRGDTAGFRQALRKVSEAVTGTDVQMIRVKSQAFYNLAIMELTDAAAAKDEATKKRLATRAEADLKEFLKLMPGDPTGTTALSRALIIQGDTAAAAAMMDEMMKSPERFSAASLFEAAGAQFTAGEFNDAVNLYEAGLAKNKLFQPAVLSYISALLRAEKYDKAIQASKLLVSIDPDGQNSLSQAAAAWQKLMLDEKTDSATQKMATDSVLHYITQAKEAPVFVKVVEFVPSDEGASFDVQINNNTAAPRSYELEVEFLNATGGVVSTAKGTFKDVGAKGAQRVVIKGTGAGITAWRYKPLKG
jgi:tetratricopeptide (TPR) repeat protein